MKFLTLVIAAIAILNVQASGYGSQPSQESRVIGRLPNFIQQRTLSCPEPAPCPVQRSCPLPSPCPVQRPCQLIDSFRHRQMDSSSESESDEQPRRKIHMNTGY